MRPNPAAPLLLALAAAAGCGGNAEKRGLRDYEAAVEGLMAQDEKVSARLADLRADLISANAAAAEQSKFAREEARPFYARSRETAATLNPAAPRLQKVHASLREYVDRRLAYLEAADAFLGADASPEMAKLKSSQEACAAAQKDLAARLQGTSLDRDVADAIRIRDLFMDQVFEPFRRGKARVDEVQAAIQTQVLPRLERVAERLKGKEGEPSTDGAVARWARAEADFYRMLSASVPRQREAQTLAERFEDEWKRGEEARRGFLADLKSYRETLR
jgi:hypothetical protein